MYSNSLVSCARPCVGFPCAVGGGKVNADTLRLLKPDMRKLAAIDARGFIVTCRGIKVGASGQESLPSAADFESRFFAPSCGIDEDPVTGSAHCFLATYWANKLGRCEELHFS